MEPTPLRAAAHLQGCEVDAGLEPMTNFVRGNEEREFLVWIDPEDFLVHHNVSFTGSFTSPPTDEAAPVLMFLPNPEFRGFISPFQNNLLRSYMADYNLEVARAQWFVEYPSRLHAIFLLRSEADAEAYRDQNPEHVSNRILKRVRTVGGYTFSTHDSSWIEFLRQGLMIDRDSLEACARAYWSGQLVRDCQLELRGRPWTREPVPEVLLVGRVDFDDRTLDGPC